ncbi:glycosyltransferase family 4 protein [Pirellulaceae bacterium SH449]
MKIAMITTGTGINGAVRHCYDLAQELAARDHSVLLIHRPGAWISSQPQHPNVSLLESTLKRKRHELKRVACILRAQDYRLLHTHLSGASFFGVLLARLYGFRSIATCHMPHFQPHWWWNDHVIVPCSSVARFQRFLNLVPRKRISTIPNFINPQRLQCSLTREEARSKLGISQSAFLLGTIGMLEERKGFLYLAEAFTRVHHSGVDIQLLSIGPQTTEYTKKVQQFIAHQAMENRIKLLGQRDDIPLILKAMDCICLPSLREVMPISLLEAMATGLPAIATKVGGVPECIRDGIDGLLVPPRNVDALTKSITDLAQAPRRVASMGHNAKQSMQERFSPEALLPRIIDIYQRYT